jgi:hypothetical protein
MNYINWASNVNKVILDSTQISLGENAVKTDTLENGKKKTRLACSVPTKTYQVTMDFDWLEQDENGLTEKDRFFNWYQYKLKYASNCFRFPSILLGNDSATYEWYRITNAISGQKSGHSIRITMTWESVYEGVISVPTQTVSIQSVNFKKNYLSLWFSETPDSYPDPSSIIVTDGTVPVTITSFKASDNVARYYYADLAAGTHTMSLSYSEIATITRIVTIE